MTHFEAISHKAIAADTAWQNAQINELDLKNVISLLDQEINELKSLGKVYTNTDLFIKFLDLCQYHGIQR